MIRVLTWLMAAVGVVCIFLAIAGMICGNVLFAMPFSWTAMFAAFAFIGLQGLEP